MIEAKDLRIGNKVDLYGSIATIETVDFAGIGIAIKEGKPIPLTEEWLLKLGFENSGGYWIKSNSSFFFGITTNGELMFLFDDALTCPANIKYVHSLQNFFFALTGKELTLNK